MGLTTFFVLRRRSLNFLAQTQFHVQFPLHPLPQLIAHKLPAGVVDNPQNCAVLVHKDFCCFAENKYDVCIITTGDDLSNIIFENKSTFESLHIVRTRKGLISLENKNLDLSANNQKKTIWVNSTITAANEIINVFDGIKKSVN